MPRLRELDAQFVGHAAGGTFWRLGQNIAGAQGLMFQCPLCSVGLERGEEDGVGHFKGAHYILVWFKNPRGAPDVPASAEPPSRWEMSGSGIDDLTLKPSVNCDVQWKDSKGVMQPSNCKFHGWVTGGVAA